MKNMKAFILVYLSLICIGNSLGQVQGQSDINVDQLSECENVSHQINVLKSGNDILKLRLEMMDNHFARQRQHQQEVKTKFQGLEEMVQKLQLRLVEQQSEHQNELKQLVGSLDSKDGSADQSEFVGAVEKPDFLREFQKVSKLQEDILAKLDNKYPSSKESVNLDRGGATNLNGNSAAISNVNVCWGIYTKILGELNSNLTILQNIDSKLNKLNEQYEGESERHKKSISVTHGLLKFLNKKEDSQICVRSDDQKLVCTAEPYPTSCADDNTTHCSNGKCRIKSMIYSSEAFQVACDNATDGGGWTVIQRRINGTEDFYRGWSEYKAGFGNLDGEFWIGLDKLHALTSSLAPVELLIQLTDHDDILKYAKYGKFSIGSELDNYELKEADDYEGNAGDSLGPHKGNKFTTKDNDNDVAETSNCAIDKRGAWWYNNCQWSNLNGIYYQSGDVPESESGEGINWDKFHGYSYSLKFVQMMIRPKKG